MIFLADFQEKKRFLATERAFIIRFCNFQDWQAGGDYSHSEFQRETLNFVARREKMSVSQICSKRSRYLTMIYEKYALVCLPSLVSYDYIPGEKIGFCLNSIKRVTIIVKQGAVSLKNM